MKIVGIGNPVFDYIRTPQVDTKTRVLSGCSTNGCLAAAKLGAETTLVGSIGEDYAPALAEGLRRYGIAGYLIPSEESGGFSLIYYDALGNRTLDVLGRAGAIEDVPVGLLADSDAVLIGPILGEVSLGLVEHIRASSPGIVLLDPQGVLRTIDSGGRVEHARNPEIDGMIPLCDVVKANEVEARIITGINPRDSEQALRESTEALHSLGCPVAIVTLAAEGSAAYDGSRYYRIPAYATDAIDPTGAGDTYAGGFLVHYLQRRSLVEACFYASCVSSVMVENVGPDFPLTAEEAGRRWNWLMENGRV
jgi:sugar/nucleoside kinase (ribokinase family)